MYADNSRLTAEIIGNAYDGVRQRQKPQPLYWQSCSRKSQDDRAGAATFDVVLEVAGAATFDVVLEVAGAATFDVVLEVAGAATFDVVLEVAGAATFDVVLEVAGA
ncbi:hypothetical protein, partial [Glaciimonas immobilis]